MIKSETIALLADTAFIFPDDYSGKNVINGDNNITESEVQQFDQSSLSFETAGTVNIEFDYGLGFNELFAQTDRNVAYKSTAAKRVRLTSVSQINNAVLTFTSPIGGL